MNDLSDLKAYIEELRAERVAAKDKERREASLVLAAAATLQMAYALFAA